MIVITGGVRRGELLSVMFRRSCQMLPRQHEEECFTSALATIVEVSKCLLPSCTPQ